MTSSHEPAIGEVGTGQAIFQVGELIHSTNICRTPVQALHCCSAGQSSTLPSELSFLWGDRQQTWGHINIEPKFRFNPFILQMGKLRPERERDFPRMSVSFQEMS
jgi:hypothetical protein